MDYGTGPHHLSLELHAMELAGRGEFAKGGTHQRRHTVLINKSFLKKCNNPNILKHKVTKYLVTVNFKMRTLNTNF